MRLSGDVSTGSFAWGLGPGSAAFGPSPELKASWVRAEWGRAAADNCSKASGGFADKIGFAI